MKKPAFIIIFIILSFHFLITSAQTQKIDSLENLLQNHTQEDTVKVNLLNTIAYQFWSINPDKLLNYAEEASRISDKLNFKKGKAKSLLRIGTYYWTKSDFDKALEYNQKALEIRKELGNKKEIASCYYGIGMIYRYQSEYLKALEYHQKGLELNIEVGDKKGASKNYLGIGTIYHIQGDFPMAIEYYQKSQQVCEEIKDKSGVAYCYYNMASIYGTQENYPKALEHFQKVLEIRKEQKDKNGIAYCLNNMGLIFVKQNDNSKALDCFKKSLELKKELGDKRGISASYTSIANLYNSMGEYDKSEELFYKALEISTEIKDKKQKAMNYFGLANLYFAKNDIKKSYRYSKKAYFIANNIEDAELIKQTSDIFAKSSAGLGLYKDAYEYHVIFKNMNDSMFNESNIEKITGLEYQYKFDKEKQATLLEQEKKDAIQAEEKKLQIIVRNSFIGGFILMFILALVVLRSFLQKRKANRILASQKEEIETQANELESSLDNIKSLTKFKDKLTQMLVHDLKNPISNIINIPDKIPSKKQKEIINYSANKMLNLVMNILDVRKYEDSKLKIKKTEQNLSELWKNATEQLKYLSQQKNIKITEPQNQEIQIIADKELILRVLVNILSNSLKYTNQNGEIKFYTKVTDTGNIKIIIKDNGIGIAKENINTIFEKYSQSGDKIDYSTGLGLTFCKIAIEEHKGKIGIESEENIGTKIWFTIPNTKILNKEIDIKTTDAKIIIEQKTELKKFLPILKETDIFQISNLRKILKAIEEKGLGNEQWVKTLNNAITNCNNEQYNTLLEILEEI